MKGGGWKNNPVDRKTKNTGGRGGGGMRLKKKSVGGGGVRKPKNTGGWYAIEKTGG